MGEKAGVPQECVMSRHEHQISAEVSGVPLYPGMLLDRKKACGGSAPAGHQRNRDHGSAPYAPEAIWTAQVGAGSTGTQCAVRGNGGDLGERATTG